MPTLPKQIEVIQRGNDYALRMDGADFPWYIHSDGVTVQVTDSSGPGVTIKILAERVDVTHSVYGPGDYLQQALARLHRGEVIAVGDESHPSHIDMNETTIRVTLSCGWQEHHVAETDAKRLAVLDGIFDRRGIPKG